MGTNRELVVAVAVARAAASNRSMYISANIAVLLIERAYALLLRSMTSLSQNRCDGDHNLGDLGSGAGAIWWTPTPEELSVSGGPTA